MSCRRNRQPTTDRRSGGMHAGLHLPNDPSRGTLVRLICWQRWKGFEIARSALTRRGHDRRNLGVRLPHSCGRPLAWAGPHTAGSALNETTLANAGRTTASKAREAGSTPAASASWRSLSVRARIVLPPPCRQPKSGKDPANAGGTTELSTPRSRVRVPSWPPDHGRVAQMVEQDVSPNSCRRVSQTRCPPDPIEKEYPGECRRNYSHTKPDKPSGFNSPPCVRPDGKRATHLARGGPRVVSSPLVAGARHDRQ